MALAFVLAVGACSSSVPNVDGGSTSDNTSNGATIGEDQEAGQPTVPVDGLAVLGRDGTVIGAISDQRAVHGVNADVVDLVLADVSTDERADGAAITTTIDVELQRHLRDALGAVPATDGRFAVSAVVVEVSTGEIVAVADTADDSSLATLQRPTGSVLKFVVALAALRNGAQADDLLDGGQRCVVPEDGRDDLPLAQRDVAQFAGDPAIGTADLSTLTALSVNCAYAKLYVAAGGDVVLGLAQGLGLDHVVDDTPRLVIGAATASPLQFARAMAVVLGDGVARMPGLIVSSTDADGAVRPRSRPEPVTIVDDAVANRTANLLRSVTEIGTASTHPLAGGRPFAGKTGTQANNTDAWFVGGTPDYVVAVWMGNPLAAIDEMVGVPEFGGVGRVQGGSFPAQVAQQFLDAALRDAPVSEWPQGLPARDPGLIVTPGVECVVGADVAVGFPIVPVGAVVEACD